MSEMKNIIEVKYLGKDSERNDQVLESKPPYNYYEMIVNVDGEDYTIVLETASSIKKKNGIHDMDNPYKKLKIDAILGPEEREDFESDSEGLVEDDGIGKIGEDVSINLDDIILDFDFPEDDYYADVYKKVISDLYQRKRNSLINARQKSFDEQEGLPTLEDDILPQLPELSQQERARKLHERMMQCVLTGRYGLDEYKDFMRKLAETVRDGKVLISDAVIKEMKHNSNHNNTSSKHIHVFPQNSRTNIANSTLEELGDVRNSSRKTNFRVMEIEPVKSEFKSYIDGKFQEDSASTLGRLIKDGENYIENSLNTGYGDIQTRRGFYVGEDEQGDIIFVEQPDWLIEMEVDKEEKEAKESNKGSELASRESRLQAAEKEAEKITEAEKLVELREGKSSEQNKDE